MAEKYYINDIEYLKFLPGGLGETKSIFSSIVLIIPKIIFLFQKNVFFINIMNLANKSVLFIFL